MGYRKQPVTMLAALHAFNEGKTIKVTTTDGAVLIDKKMGTFAQLIMDIRLKTGGRLTYYIQ